MHAPLRLFAAAALAAAAFGAATPANAACAGTTGTAYVCLNVHPAGLPTVNPTGGSIDDCVYLGPGPCRPVSVPFPTVTPGSGAIVTGSCGGAMLDPIAACRI